MTVLALMEQEKRHPTWQERRAQMLRLWLKPRIKRISGDWYCEARGVVGYGFSPAAAYGSWLNSVRKMDVQISYQGDPWQMKPSCILKSRGAA